MSILERIARVFFGLLSFLAFLAGLYFLGRATVDLQTMMSGGGLRIAITESAVLGVGWLLVGIFIQMLLANASMNGMIASSVTIRAMLARIGKLLQ